MRSAVNKISRRGGHEVREGIGRGGGVESWALATVLSTGKRECAGVRLLLFLPLTGAPAAPGAGWGL
jgi:hypothetical protein